MNKEAEKEFKLTLIAQGEELNMQIHPNTSLKNMLQMINMALIYKHHSAPVIETKISVIKNPAEARREAQKRVRVKVVNMDPTRKDHTAELFCFANSVIGSVKQVVPLDSEEGFHIPQVLIETIREKKYRVTKYRKGGPNGKDDIPYNVELPSFSVEVLPALSAAELENIKQRQLAHAKID
jgi:hypothetical protein